MEDNELDQAKNVQGPNIAKNLRTRPLKPLQERKLMNYLDDQLLQLMRNHKKRTEETSSTRTLSDYLDAARIILALVLQIPPAAPSGSLRIAYLLRLTGDTLSAIAGYRLDPAGISNDQQPIFTTYGAVLRGLLDFLDDIDCAWEAVLKAQVWDASSGAGVDEIVDVNTVGQGTHILTLINQTEVTRLRSLLIAGGATLEEWLEEQHNQLKGDDEVEDVSDLLERMGLLEDFDQLFERTWVLLDTFGGSRDPEMDV